MRALAGTLLFVALSSLWQMAVPPSVAGAQTDLTFISSSTWTADPSTGRVHILALITATSHTTDADGRRYYYDQLQLTLPQGSTSLSATSVSGATSAGSPLAITVMSTSPSGVVAVVPLGQRLYAGDSASFNLSFDLVDPGGSTDRDLRFGHNLMSFPVSAFGSPGVPGSSVTVQFPPNFTVQEEFGGLTRASSGFGETIFTSGPIDDSTALNAWFTAVKPVPASEVGVRLTTIGPLQVTLRYWADDPGWADQVERVLRSAYPELRDLIGLGDPAATTLSVAEASTQELGGFSGSYDQSNGQVQISYFADPFVIVHEAAHMWFNSVLTSDRWVNEGFASYYAQETINKLGLVGHPPLLTDRLRKAAVPFNDWTAAVAPGSATEGYLYGASLEVARQIAEAAGQDSLRTVWVAVRSGVAAYQPASEPGVESVAPGGSDWRRLLDLLEQNTGRSFVPIWRGWVVNSSQAALLTLRSTTLNAYAAAQAAANPWSLPPDIRRSLDDWDFEGATALMDQAGPILNQRDRIAAASALDGTVPPPKLKDAFETVGISAASSEATAELAVLAELALARQARSQGEGDGVARSVGLIGTDPEANLQAARAAFAGGDLARALTLAAAARSSWEGASTSGQVRVIGALCVLVGLIMLLLLLVWIRRERSQSGLRADDEEVASEPSS